MRDNEPQTVEELQEEVKRLESIKNEFIAISNEAYEQYKVSEEQQRKYMQMNDEFHEMKYEKQMKMSADAKKYYERKAQQIEKKIKLYKKRIEEMKQ